MDEREQLENFFNNQNEKAKIAHVAYAAVLPGDKYVTIAGLSLREDGNGFSGLGCFKIKPDAINSLIISLLKSKDSFCKQFELPGP